ncbi:MAG: Ig-like domain-containing protein, partial [Parabacteroides sp.]|nr:Ig-like domain-containing protein [Parabacteroides sp.]
SSDGWSKTFNSNYLLQTVRYYYPSIVSSWAENDITENSITDKIEVTPLLALKSSEKRHDTELDWSKIDNSAGIRLCFGQVNINDDVNSSYGKHINEIELFLNSRADFESILESINKNIPGDGGTAIDTSEIDVFYDESGRGSGDPGLVADTLTIKVGYFGSPYSIKKVYTRKDLGQMPQVQQAYTWIDRMPAVVMNSARGVKLEYLLEDAGIDINSIETCYFYCKDVKNTWYQALPKAYLLDMNRYYYPNLPDHWDMDIQAPTFGATIDAKKVDTIIALEDHWERFRTEPNFKDMTITNSYRLVFGQTDALTPNAFRSAKWIHSIEIMLGGTPPKDVFLNEKMLQLKVGSTFKLQATVEGDDKNVDKRITWSSNNPDAVTVDNEGNITVLKDEEAIIKVSTINGKKTAVCIINGGDKDKSSGGTDNVDGDTGLLVADGSGRQPWRIYEISEDAVALAMPETDKTLTVYAGVLLVICYFFGAIIRYLKDRREVA